MLWLRIIEVADRANVCDVKTLLHPLAYAARPSPMETSARDAQGKIKLSFPLYAREFDWAKHDGMTIAIREDMHFHSTGLLMPDGQFLTFYRPILPVSSTDRTSHTTALNLNEN